MGQISRWARHLGTGVDLLLCSPAFMLMLVLVILIAEQN